MWPTGLQQTHATPELQDSEPVLTVHKTMADNT